MTTRDEILDAAEAVMRELGLAKATTKEIARAAGYSEATLYKHFADKTEIFLAVLSERLPELGTTLRELTAAAGSRTVQANLTRLAHDAMEFYTQVFPIAASLFSETKLLAAHRRRLAELDAGPQLVNLGLVGYLRAEQRQGRVRRGADLDAVAALLLGACFQHAFLVTFAGERPSQRELNRRARALATTVLAALEPARA